MQQVTMVRLLEEKACYMADSIDETLTPADLKEALEMVSESYYQSATQRLIIFSFQASKISFASFEFFYSFRSLLWHGSLVPRPSIGSGCYSYTVVSGYEICGTVIPPTYDFNTIAEIALSS